jgi:hypothetical protein
MCAKAASTMLTVLSRGILFYVSQSNGVQVEGEPNKVALASSLAPVEELVSDAFE